MMRFFLAINLLTLITFGVTAQDKELFTLNYSYSPIRHNGASGNVQRLNANVLFPIYNHLPLMIFGGIGYRNHYLHNLPIAFGTGLHSIPLQLGFMYKFNNRQSINGGFLFGVNSDMKHFSPGDFTYSGNISYKIKYRDNLKIGYGLAYSQQMFGGQILPIIDFYYKPSAKWTYSGKFPIRERVEYGFNPKNSIGIGLDFGANSFRLTQSKEAGDFVRFFQFETLAYYEYKLTKHWRINLQGGYNIAQKYELYAQDTKPVFGLSGIWLGKKPEPVQEIKSNGLNVRIGLCFVVEQK